MDMPPGADNQSLSFILAQCLTGQSNAAMFMQLAALLQADCQQVNAFHIQADQVQQVVQERLQLLRASYPAVSQFCQQTMGWGDRERINLWNLWLPLAVQVAEWQRQLGHPLVQGILGGQGTGKTTLSAILALILQEMGLRVCRLSLDDLYKTYAERQHLQASEPRLRWRGPPGTHDVELGLEVLQRLRQPHPTQPVQVPRFDKSAWNGAGDRAIPETVMGADIILFEGWFVGVHPINPLAFETAPPPILNEADRDFARSINHRLHDYVPLWQQLDHLILLYLTDYRLSQKWRKQAEQQMVAKGQTGMGDTEIDQFVEYFWRSLHPELFVQPLLHDATQVDLVIEILPTHQPGAVYIPGSSPHADPPQTSAPTV